MQTVPASKRGATISLNLHWIFYEMISTMDRVLVKEEANK